MKIKPLFTICLFALSSSLYAQKNSSIISKEDSLQIIQELAKDLAILFGDNSTPVSYANFRLGMGNAFFTTRTTSTTTSITDKVFYSASGSYNHKSGLGLTVSNLIVPENSNLTLFQTLVSPSYDYMRSKNVGFGVSYTHYFIKDSLSFETSPLVDEFYGYFTYKKSFFRPTIGVNYATGMITEEAAASGSTPAYKAVTRVQDITLLASIQHYFTSKGFMDKDQITFSPSLMAIAGTSYYGTNLSVGSLGRNTKHFNNPNVINKVKKKKKDIIPGLPLPTDPPTTTSTSENTDFTLQGISLVLGGDYSIGKFSLQPQMLLSYNIPAVSKKFNTLFSATLGITL